LERSGKRHETLRAQAILLGRPGRAQPPYYRHLAGRDLDAIYAYLSAIPSAMTFPIEPNPKHEKFCKLSSADCSDVW
jgi:hypothetical protein